MRRLRIGFVAALLLGACAKAEPAGDDDGPAIDASTPIDSSGPPIDAEDMPDGMPPGPMARTLTQSNATTITDLHTINCNQFQSGFARTGENRFYRVFDLPALGIDTTYTATRVDFGIEEAASTTGSMTLQVKLHTLNVAPGNGFNLTALTQIYSQNVNVTTPQTLTTLQVPLTTPVVVPQGSRLVVEVFAPDMTALAVNNYIFLGSNASGETGLTYVQWNMCTQPNPVRYFPNVTTPDPQVHWVMAVQGTVP
jgi:hypothetical protein